MPSGSCGAHTCSYERAWHLPDQDTQLHRCCCIWVGVTGQTANQHAHHKAATEHAHQQPPPLYCLFQVGRPSTSRGSCSSVRLKHEGRTSTSSAAAAGAAGLPVQGKSPQQQQQDPAPEQVPGHHRNHCVPRTAYTFMAPNWEPLVGRSHHHIRVEKEVSGGGGGHLCRISLMAEPCVFKWRMGRRSLLLPQPVATGLRVLGGTVEETAESAVSAWAAATCQSLHDLQHTCRQNIMINANNFMQPPCFAMTAAAY
jgi:hypothetical protein